MLAAGLAVPHPNGNIVRKSDGAKFRLNDILPSPLIVICHGKKYLVRWNKVDESGDATYSVVMRKSRNVVLSLADLIAGKPANWFSEVNANATDGQHKTGNAL